MQVLVRLETIVIRQLERGRADLTYCTRKIFMNIRDIKDVCSKKFYERRESERTSSYIWRTMIGMNIVFLFVGLPFLCILAMVEGESIPEYLLSHALPAYVGLIVGGPIGLLLLRQLKT